MKLKKDDGMWAFVEFRYERLPTFCFLCGVIGHGDRVCPGIIHGIDRKADKPFGAWLRAGSRRAAPTSGQRWVAPESDADRLGWKSRAMEAVEAAKQSEKNESGKEPMQMSTGPAELVPFSDSSNEKVPSVTIGNQKRRRPEEETSDGHRGGLALLWFDNLEVEVTSFSHNHIDAFVTVDAGSPEWRFTGFYVMGDFNDLLEQHEKRGRLPHPDWLLLGFKEAVVDCGLVDFPFTGHQFTWERGRGTTTMVEEKLDRILVTDTWLTLFDRASTSSLTCPYSDHMPLFLSPAMVAAPPRRKRFCFDNMWLREDIFKEIVEQSWYRTAGLDILDRVAACSNDIWRWDRNYNKEFQKRIDRCKSNLDRLRNRRDNKGFADYIRTEKELLLLLEQQHLFSKQRAKEHWWKGGDLNTKFFS
nr:uncharacterized protein LOC109157277 [Ipomoea batatas]